NPSSQKPSLAPANPGDGQHQDDKRGQDSHPAPPRLAAQRNHVSGHSGAQTAQVDQQFSNGLIAILRIFLQALKNNVLEYRRYLASDGAGQRRLIVEDRKSTRLNSSHVAISYAVFCLKKKIEKI